MFVKKFRFIPFWSGNPAWGWGQNSLRGIESEGKSLARDYYHSLYTSVPLIPLKNWYSTVLLIRCAEKTKLMKTSASSCHHCSLFRNFWSSFSSFWQFWIMILVIYTRLIMFYCVKSNNYLINKWMFHDRVSWSFFR